MAIIEQWFDREAGNTGMPDFSAWLAANPGKKILSNYKVVDDDATRIRIKGEVVDMNPDEFNKELATETKMDAIITNMEKGSASDAEVQKALALLLREFRGEKGKEVTAVVP